MTRSSRPHLPELDGLRGIAILMVMVFHFAAFADEYCLKIDASPESFAYWAKAVIFCGWSGVDLFFVLSGFLITGILFSAKEGGKNQRAPAAGYFRNFYLRRTLRIFPLYYALLLLWPVVTIYFDEPGGTAHLHEGHMAWLWTYTSNWLEGWRGVDGIPKGLQHFWTLAIEEQFYLVWPILIFGCSRKQVLWICGLILVGSPFLRGAFAANDQILAAWAWTPCRIDALAAGGLLSLGAPRLTDWRGGRVIIYGLGATGFAGLLALLISRGELRPDDPPVTILAPFFLALLFTAALLFTLRRGKRALSWRPLRWFGTYSYGLYVWHQPIAVFVTSSGLMMELVRRVGILNLPVMLVEVFTVPFALSLIAAVVSRLVIENPFLRLKDRVTREGSACVETLTV